MSEIRKPLPQGENNLAAELPPDVARYQEMLLELQDEMAKLREIFEQNKDKPAMIFAMRIADISETSLAPVGGSSFHAFLTDDIKALNEGRTFDERNKKKFAEEFHAFFAWRLLRADAILQTYVLPAIDPPSTEVQDFANGVHSLTSTDRVAAPRSAVRTRHSGLVAKTYNSTTMPEYPLS